jgi:hypothetical protein
LVLIADVCLEVWGGEAPFDGASWTAHELRLLDLPSGVLGGVDEGTAGGESDVVEAPTRGKHWVRVARSDRPGSEGRPQPYVLVQLWPQSGCDGQPGTSATQV